MILTKSSAPQASYAKTWLPLDGKPDKNHNKTDRILHDKCAARDAALDPRSSSIRVLTVSSIFINFVSHLVIFRPENWILDLILLHRTTKFLETNIFSYFWGSEMI